MWEKIHLFMEAQPLGLRLLIIFAFFWVVNAGLSRVWETAATHRKPIKEGEEQ